VEVIPSPIFSSTPVSGPPGRMKQIPHKVARRKLAMATKGENKSEPTTMGRKTKNTPTRKNAEVEEHINKNELKTINKGFCMIYGKKFPFHCMGDVMYLPCTDCFEIAGLNKHIRARGYKNRLDPLLKSHGYNHPEEAYIFSGQKKRKRKMIEVNAFLTILQFCDFTEKPEKEKTKDDRGQRLSYHPPVL
jgi:hypothetical protein